MPLTERLRRRLSMLLLAVAALAAGGGSLAQSDAGGIDPATAEALAGLATTDRAALGEAIDRVAAQRDADALPILFALRDRRLYFTGDQTLIIEDAEDETLREAISGQPRADLDTSELDQPMVTNTVRRALRPTIAGLQLFAHDPAARREAAAQLAESPQPELRSAMEGVIAEGTDARTERLLGIALAQLDLDSDDPQRRSRYPSRHWHDRTLFFNAKATPAYSARDSHPQSRQLFSGSQSVGETRKPCVLRNRR